MYLVRTNVMGLEKPERLTIWKKDGNLEQERLSSTMKHERHDGY